MSQYLLFNNVKNHINTPVEMPEQGNINTAPSNVRHAKLEEQILAERMPVIKDMSEKDTGWRRFERRNLGNQLLAITLITLDGKYAVDILNKIPSSGTEQYRTNALAHAYAIDHAYVAVTPEHEHAGFNIYPLWMQSGELLYAVQSINNLEKGNQSGFGDALLKTVKEAHAVADRQQNEHALKIAQEAKEIEITIEKNAKMIANSLLSISERRVNSVLDKPMNYLTLGLLNGTRRESMEFAINKGCEFAAVNIHDEASKNKDLKVIGQVNQKGYILGLSNENIPLVKDGLAAQQRLKENNYFKPEYRLYRTSREEGVFREITKTEFDYAMNFKQKIQDEKKVTTNVVKSSGIVR